MVDEKSQAGRKCLACNLPMLTKDDQYALILGTGGASKAVAYVFDKIGLEIKFVSRKPSEGQWHYSDLTMEVIEKFSVIVNTTPLGTHPDINSKPDIPYNFLSGKHLLFDLIYNPEKTSFLKEAMPRSNPPRLPPRA